MTTQTNIIFNQENENKIYQITCQVAIRNKNGKINLMYASQCEILKIDNPKNINAEYLNLYHRDFLFHVIPRHIKTQKKFRLADWNFIKASRIKELGI